MGRHKGGKNKVHSQEEKLKYVKMMIDEGYSPQKIEREFGISHSLTDVWRRKHLRFGEDSLNGNGITNHKEALNDMLNSKIKRGYKSQETISHSDQGAIYSSMSFNNIFTSYNITRSMSRTGNTYR